jgi:hypothetical protein
MADKKLAEEKRLAEQKLAKEKLELEKQQKLKELILNWKNGPIVARAMTYGYESTVLMDMICKNVDKESYGELFSKLLIECDMLIDYLNAQLDAGCWRAGDPYEAVYWAKAELSAYESFKEAVSKKSVA